MDEITQRAEGISVEIGDMPILLRTRDALFRQMLTERYAGFIGSDSRSQFQLDIDVSAPHGEDQAEKDVDVRVENGEWVLERGDFRASWNQQVGKGHVSQTPNPYAIDSVLRIVHTLILARAGGFLLHSASAIRNGKAFLFTGVSGAGKTTISRLAPPDVTLLTDEVSYVKRVGDVYQACGTPFAGDLARVGENQSAPIDTIFLLQKGVINRREDVDAQATIRAIMRSILFFANDTELVNMVFQSACDFVDHVPVQQLTFVPDQRVWDLIG